jgi:uncharacterized membrane protein (DUF485 family)
MSVSQLSAQRWKVAMTLSALVVILYFGFVLLIAFDKQLVARQIAPGLSLGILLGALVIVVAWLSTWVYMRWANQHFDKRAQELRSGSHEP